LSQKRRITFTVINDLSYDQRMRKICGSMAKNGYDVLLIGRRLPTSLPLDKELYQQKRLKCFINKGKLFYLEYNIRLFWTLLFTKVDILSAIDCDTLWANYFVSRLRNKKLGYDAHELFSEVPEVIRRPSVQKVWKKTEKWLIPKTDYSYTVCKSIADHFENLYNKKFEVIMNAPHLNGKQIEKEDSSEKYILYQGALNEGRGLEALIKAMKYVDSKLYLIGEGDITSKLKKLAKEQEVSEKVLFLGYLKAAEMKPYTDKAYMGINVSENLGLSYYYSLNNKFFDYIHSGLPSIMNDFPEYRVLNDKYQVGITAEARWEDLADKINLLLNDSALHEKLKNNCVIASRELSWEIEEKKLLRVYDPI
jgi:glycosyltransferase involved in cell wall biosynthesis